jgi:hypothetical protein
MPGNAVLTVPSKLELWQGTRWTPIKATGHQKPLGIKSAARAKGWSAQPFEAAPGFAQSSELGCGHLA